MTWYCLYSPLRRRGFFYLRQEFEQVLITQTISLLHKNTQTQLTSGWSNKQYSNLSYFISNEASFFFLNRFHFCGGTLETDRMACLINKWDKALLNVRTSLSVVRHLVSQGNNIFKLFSPLHSTNLGDSTDKFSNAKLCRHISPTL